MQFAGYFLVVWDFIHYAKEQGIAVGPGPRLGGRVAGRLLPRHHRPRSAALRAHLRAIPEPGAASDARHRHRLRRRPARRGDPSTSPRSTGETAWPRSSRSERSRRRRPSGTSAACSACRTATSTRSPSSCPSTAEHHPRRRLQAEPAARRGGEEPTRGRRALADRQAPRGPGTRHARQARRRRRDLRRAAHGARPALPGPQERGDHHPVPDGADREARPPQDGLPRPPDAHRASPTRCALIEETPGAPASTSSGSRSTTPRPTSSSRRRGPSASSSWSRRACGRAPAAPARAARGPHRHGRALPARPDGDDPRLHRAPARAGKTDVRASRHGEAPAGDVRDHGLPGAGHADRLRHGRLLDERGRQPPEGHGQEERRALMAKQRAKFLRAPGRAASRRRSPSASSS